MTWLAHRSGGRGRRGWPVQGSPTRTGIGTCGLALAALVFGSPVARADSAETESRLKRVGVSEGLRRRVHQSIEKAVSHFAAIQKPSGAFGGGVNPKYAAPSWHPGVTVLAGLACRHAGTPQGREVAERASAWFVEEIRSYPKDPDRLDVYSAGIGLMLLEAQPGHGDDIRAVAAALAASQHRGTGWWDYDTPWVKGKIDGRTLEWIQRGRLPNLSTSQFAVLGLWAAARAGAEVPSEVWERHLESLLDSQTEGGSWEYDLTGDYAPYPCGTFMGTANLILCLGALEGGEVRDEAKSKSEAVLQRALKALERDGVILLRRLRRGYPTHNEMLAYYDLYALEKVCLFAGKETLGGVPWYAAMAEVLVDTQNKDGGWGCLEAKGPESRWLPYSSPVTTAFALLILVRASEHYRTVTPRPIDSPRAVATGTVSEAEPTAEPDGDAGGPPPPSVVDARAALVRLREGLEDAQARAADLRAAVDIVARAHRGGPTEGGDPTPVDEAWRREAEGVLLAAGFPGPRCADPLGVRLDAIEALGACDPRVVPGLLRALDEWVLGRTQEGWQWEIRQAGFRALAALGGDAALRWLVDRALDPGESPEELRSARLALAAVPRFQGLSWTVRRTACRTLLDRFKRVREAPPSPEAAAMGIEPAPTFDPPERTTQDDLMEALLSLARDPVTGRAPTLASGAWAGTPARFELWWKDHSQPGRSPWR